MTVKQLIERLQQYDDTLEVAVNESESGDDLNVTDMTLRNRRYDHELKQHVTRPYLLLEYL